MTSALLRAQDVNFGDRTPLRGGERKTLAWIQLEKAAPFTLYASATPSDRSPSPRTMAKLTVEWGHGGASMAKAYPLVGQVRIPLVASTIKVEGSIVDATTGGPPPRDVEASLSVFLAQGTDGQTLLFTETIVQSGSEGSIGVGPIHVLGVAGYNASSRPLWIMFFDERTVPSDGARPAMAVPAEGRGRLPFAIQPRGTRAFVHGLVWATSLDPLALKRASGASVHLEVELLV